MNTAWSPAELARIDDVAELEIAPRRPDGTSARFLPIWVVRVGDQVFVRTWHRRDRGWFGHVVRSRRAGIRVPGLEAEIVVDDVGGSDAGLRAGVDAAYRAKYAMHGDASVARMITDEAAAATLRLRPRRDAGTDDQ